MKRRTKQPSPKYFTIHHSPFLIHHSPFLILNSLQMHPSKTHSNSLILNRTAAALKHNGFETAVVENADEARAFIVAAAQGAKTIGQCGSVTVIDLNVIPELAKNAEILNHSAPDLTNEQRLEVMRRQQTCDLMICSANAISTNGEIVNIDGVGNRVSASVFGPANILIVAGRNKIAEGGIAEALKRAKDSACPTNAHRVGRTTTPCVKTGKCHNCDSPERICRVTVIMERKPSRSDVTVLLVNEDFGF